MYLNCLHRLWVGFRFLNNLTNIMHMSVKNMYLPEKLGVTVS
jgi:hypothetical protein